MHHAAKCSRRGRAVAALVVFWALGQATRVDAHGLPPGTTSIRTRTGQPNDWMVGSNFGPLISTGGQPYRVICAEGIGYPEGFETSFHWTASGRMIVGNASGLFTSPDGCTWTALPELAEEGVTDLYADPASGALLVTTSRYGRSNGLWASTNDGQSFSATALANSGLYFTAVRSSAARPGRWVVSAWWYDPAVVRIFHSDNAGGTWTETVPNISAAGPFFLLGISPTQPDVLFAWLSNAEGDFVMRSSNGGATFTQVLEARGGRRDLVFSDDGNTLWLSTTQQIYRSTDAGLTFAALDSPQGNACLFREGQNLYTCGATRTDGFAVGKSTNGGDNFERIFNLDQVTGIFSCPAGTPVHDQCEPLWSSLRVNLLDASQPPPIQLNPSRGGCSSTGASGFALGLVVLWLWGQAAVARRLHRS